MANTQSATSIPSRIIRQFKPQHYQLIYDAPSKEELLSSGHAPLQIQIGDDQYVYGSLVSNSNQWQLFTNVTPQYNPLITQAVESLSLLLNAQGVERQGEHFQAHDAFTQSGAEPTPWLLPYGRVDVTIAVTVARGLVVAENLHLASMSQVESVTLRWSDFGRAPAIEPPPTHYLAPSPCGNSSITLPTKVAVACGK